MDAITLLKADHKAVKSMFTAFGKLGDNAHSSKRELVDKMIEALPCTRRSRKSCSTRLSARK
jgi:hypothetical protein